MRSLPLVEVHQAGPTCVSRVPIFAGLNGSQQASVGSYARPLALTKGELLPHGATGQLFVVHTGKIKIVHTAPSGREHLIRVAGPGDAVGEHAFLTGESPDHYAEALSDTRLCVFAHADLAKLVHAYPPIALGMLRDLSTRTTDAERRVALGAVDVSVRIASYLLDLPAIVEAGVPRVRLPLSKRDTASYLATTPESFSRALARLQRGGMIAVRGAIIELLDPAALDDLIAEA